MQLDQQVVGYAQPFGTGGISFGMPVKRYDFAVYRIEQAHWEGLPELLRPKARKASW